MLSGGKAMHLSSRPMPSSVLSRIVRVSGSSACDATVCFIIAVGSAGRSQSVGSGSLCDDREVRSLP